jgi:predicted RNA-binding protein Jag
MSSRERWIVHTVLRTIAGVRTESVGEGRLKRVKIVPS